jgi:hypothetical protein
LLSTARIWAEKIKHADHCAPTLLKFLNEAFGFENEEESKADVRWQKSEVSKKKVSHTQSIQL